MNQKSEPISSIFETLKKHNIHPNKFMGQNFLIDENVLDKIIEASNLKPNDTILEVGPGLGILTMELAKRLKPARHGKPGVAGGKVIAVEKDKKMCEILREMLDTGGVGNVEIINEDILKMTNDQFSMTNYKIVANIPYYLTSPLIRKFLEADQRPLEIILMIQKEVAQRICASPPKMSLLAISVQFYANPEIICYVPKTCFYPVPKVDSAIIKIIPRSYVGHTMSYINTKKFFELVKTGFSSKRKMLKNNLSNIDLEKVGLNPKIRAENLSINNWIKLYELSENFLKK